MRPPVGWMDPGEDGPRSGPPGGPPSGATQGVGIPVATLPLSGPAPGLRLRPVGLSRVPDRAQYEARTLDRHAALQQIDEGCYWHMLPVEFKPDLREVVLARRELYMHLVRSQEEDDKRYGVKNETQ